MTELRTKTKSNLNNSLRHLRAESDSSSQKSESSCSLVSGETNDESYRHLRSNKNKKLEIANETQTHFTSKRNNSPTIRNNTQSSDQNLRSDNLSVTSTTEALILTNTKNANNKLTYNNNNNNLTASSSTSPSSSPLIYNSTNTSENIFINNNNNNINNSSSSIFNATKQQPNIHTITTTTTTTNNNNNHKTKISLKKKISITSSSSLLLKKKYRKILHGQHNNKNTNTNAGLKRLLVLKRKRKLNYNQSNSSTVSLSTSISSSSSLVSNLSLITNKNEAIKSKAASSVDYLDDASISRRQNSEFLNYIQSSARNVSTNKQNEHLTSYFYWRSSHLKRSKSAFDSIYYGIKLNEEKEDDALFKKSIYFSRTLFKSRSLSNLNTSLSYTQQQQQQHTRMNEMLQEQVVVASCFKTSPSNGNNNEEQEDKQLVNSITDNSDSISKDDKENNMNITNELIVKREANMVDDGQEEIIDGFSFFSFEHETDLKVN
jgi:hypothetical protein